MESTRQTPILSIVRHRRVAANSVANLSLLSVAYNSPPGTMGSWRGVFSSVLRRWACRVGDLGR